MFNRMLNTMGHHNVFTPELALKKSIQADSNEDTKKVQLFTQLADYLLMLQRAGNMKCLDINFTGMDDDKFNTLTDLPGWK